MGLRGGINQRVGLPDIDVRAAVGKIFNTARSPTGTRVTAGMSRIFLA